MFTIVTCVYFCFLLFLDIWRTNQINFQKITKTKGSIFLSIIRIKMLFYKNAKT